MVRCQPRDGGLQRWNREDNTGPQGLLLSQAQHVQLRPVFKWQKAGCMPNPFENLVKEMLLWKTSPSAGTGLSYTPGVGCSIELDLCHRTSLLQYTHKTCQNRKTKIDPAGPFRSAPWRQGMEGHCSLTPQHEAPAPQVSALTGQGTQTLFHSIRACTWTFVPMSFRIWQGLAVFADPSNTYQSFEVKLFNIWKVFVMVLFEN